MIDAIVGLANFVWEAAEAVAVGYTGYRIALHRYRAWRAKRTFSGLWDGIE